MHIGGRQCDIAQGGRSESISALVAFVAETQLLIIDHAQHVRLVVAEHRPVVAGVAAVLDKQHHAPLLGVGHGRFVAALVAVVGSIVGQ